ncbi:hypothetical protein MLD38_017167 [Melastoma candidum]|uniref:Uncharacterized protein n=1 Tax=Melastoma candidum TaxID=119954 RepID=A0ACB9QQB4_9MYRT|nr:hypothetical protein MLD38_017167 [Melastoma candidum]
MGRKWREVAAIAVAVTFAAVSVVTVGKRVRKRREWGRVEGIVRELEKECETDVGRLRQLADALAVEMNAGLASEGGSKLKMLLTDVDRLPDGSEKGIYYALDLGGTNFRALQVHLGGQRSSILSHDVERQPIPRHLMTSTSEELFDFVAAALKSFVENKETCDGDVRDSGRELGFTFSFPVNQTSVSSGILIRWTKGFAIEDMVGKDVSESLQLALRRKGLDMRIVALVNDSVGTLALGYYHDPDTVAAVIFGTGTNACYIERREAIIKCQGLNTSFGIMVVNMEWGSFWSSHLPRTSYDIELDLDSPNPTEQGFEKMISGMYLGEIARKVILRMAQESDSFGVVPSKLSTPFILRTPMMAAMHEDESQSLSEVDRILSEILEVPEVHPRLRKLVMKVCDIITRRAARLAAAGIVGILKKIGREGERPLGSRSGHDTTMRRTVVAVEGGLYVSYTMFREYLHEALEEILGEDIARHVVLQVTEDGSGIGAALVAAAHSSTAVHTR